jgi:hypothetical protein
VTNTPRGPDDPRHDPHWRRKPNDAEKALSVDNPKKALGDLKPSVHFVPMEVMLQVAKVMELGAKKYGRMNWREQPIQASTYYSAMFRHMIAWFEGEDVDPESGQPHLAHAICCAMLVLDSERRGILIDDRFDFETKTSGVGT